MDRKMLRKLLLPLLLGFAAASAVNAQTLNVATLRGVVSAVQSCNVDLGAPGPITVSLPSCAGVAPGACVEVTGQVSNDLTTGGMVISVVGRIWSVLAAEECTGDYDATAGRLSASAAATKPKKATLTAPVKKKP